MARVEFTWWEEDGWLLGYLNEFPDNWTQGSDLNDLKEHLLDLYRELASGAFPGVKRTGVLEIDDDLS